MARFSGAFIVLIAMASAAVAGLPWEVKKLFALTAVGLLEHKPGGTADDWNVSSIGVWCGSNVETPQGKLEHRKIGVSLYLYGPVRIPDLSPPKIEATILIDGREHAFSFYKISDLAHTTVTPDFVRALAKASNVSVVLTNFRKPFVETVNMSGARVALQKALANCVKL